MFWTKKRATAVEPSAAVEPPKPGLPSKQQELEVAAKGLASALRKYAEASYAAKQSTPDEELIAAYRKVEIARQIVTEGRIAYALGRCLPEHMAHWHAWSEREDFQDWVGFEAEGISSSQTTEETGVRRIEVTTNGFTFRGRPYRLVFRDSGLSSAPGDDTYRGEVVFFSEEICVARFSVSKDLMDEYAQWKFVDVSGFRIGSWMQDVLDMAAQIDASRVRSMNKFLDGRTREAAAEIDLG